MVVVVVVAAAAVALRVCVCLCARVCARVCVGVCEACVCVYGGSRSGTAMLAHDRNPTRSGRGHLPAHVRPPVRVCVCLCLCVCVYMCVRAATYFARAAAAAECSLDAVDAVWRSLAVEAVSTDACFGAAPSTLVHGVRVVSAGAVRLSSRASG